MGKFQLKKMNPENNQQIDIDINLVDDNKQDQELRPEPVQPEPEKSWWEWGLGKVKEGVNKTYETVTDPNFTDNVKEGVNVAWDKTKEGATYVKDKVTDTEFQE